MKQIMRQNKQILDKIDKQSKELSIILNDIEDYTRWVRQRYGLTDSSPVPTSTIHEVLESLRNDESTLSIIKEIYSDAQSTNSQNEANQLSSLYNQLDSPSDQLNALSNEYADSWDETEKRNNSI